MVYDKEESAKRAVAAFNAVFECGPKIQLDHHLVYHARESYPFLYSSFVFFGGGRWCIWRVDDFMMWRAFNIR